MIELELHREDLGGEWESGPRGWTAGRSSIAPFPHRALEAHAFGTSAQTLFLVRERCGSRGEPVPAPVHRIEPECFSALLADARNWSLDFVHLLITRHAAGAEVALECGCWGTAPLYLLHDGDYLRGDWDPARLFPRCRRHSPDPALAAHFLVELGIPYSRHTLLPDLQLLTERSSAAWCDRRGGALRIDYAPAVARPRPGRLREGADGEEEFKRILSSSMRRWLDARDPRVATELSGGLDSAIVTAVGAQLSRRPVMTFGLLMPGEPGAGQRRRRGELIERFELDDRSLPGEAALPFSPVLAALREPRAVPWEECYVEAFSLLLGEAAARGVEVELTGVGGNELCALDYEEMDEAERQAFDCEEMIECDAVPDFLSPVAFAAYRDSLLTLDRAPRGRMADSALGAAAAAAPIYLHHGVWPVNPLCTPELVDFCARLPREWRAGRALSRRLLAGLGCSREVTHPSSTENFAPLMAASLRGPARPRLERLFRGSRLAQAGLVDGKKLQESYARFCHSRGQGQELAGQEVGFYAAAVLELMLRELEPRTEDVESEKFPVLPCRSWTAGPEAR